MTRGPLAATDRRRQAGHKHFRKPGSEEESNKESNGSAKSLGHLFSDRRKPNGAARRSA